MKKPARRWETAPFSDLLKRVPRLPDATTLRKTGLPLSERELQVVRHAMAVHTASRQPQLTWEGWKLIGAAMEIGTRHATRMNRGPIRGRNVPLTDFLRATGFTFINKAVRSVLRQCMAHLDDIEAWRESLDRNDRAHLNNPIDLWERFNSDGRAPREGGPTRVNRHHHRAFPNLLEELEVMGHEIERLEEARALLEEVIRDLLGRLPQKSRQDTLAQFPDALLKKLFSLLPEDIQDALHERLFAAPEGDIVEP